MCFWRGDCCGRLLNHRPAGPPLNQFGVAYSYRRRYSRGNLNYFCLQDVARFMRTREKILIKAICEQLRIHIIDASDFKESLTAYINQGVINSGDIRGNVLTSIKSFVFRRPARAAQIMPRRKVANHLRISRASLTTAASVAMRLCASTSATANWPARPSS